MNDQDIDNHPSHAAYCAGRALATFACNLPPWQLQKAADAWDDRAAFMEGFNEVAFKMEEEIEDV
jgi:hypothetical protein